MMAADKPLTALSRVLPVCIGFFALYNRLDGCGFRGTYDLPKPRPYGRDRSLRPAFAAFFRVSRSGRFLTLKIEYDSALREVWVKRFKDACEAISVRDPSDGRGLLPAFARRMLEELRRPQTDWRAVLNDFVQEEITDYSFMPPDYRFGDSPFFLPAYSEKDDLVKDILFMIDTSGSVSDKQMTAAYSEIRGAIDQFSGRLRGWLGFFDAAIVEPQPFEDEEEFRAIRPAGGGGTDFQIIFEYVAQHMQDNQPVSIVILTDGFAPFPQEELAGGIPTLWLLNNEQVQPPWGKVARIKAEETAV